MTQKEENDIRIHRQTNGNPTGAMTNGKGNAPRQGTHTRQSNMELLRLISMMLVLMMHANYFSLGIPCAGDLAAEPLTTVLRVAAEHLSLVGVNVFVLISGWFGIRPRWQGLAGLLFTVAFLSAATTAVFLAAGLPVNAGATVLAGAAIGSAYWFIVAYAGLYILSPVLNAFAESATQRRLGRFLACFFTFEFVYGFATDSGMFSSGYSIISFAGLYLLARYARRSTGRWTRLGAGTYLAAYAAIMLTGAALYIAIIGLTGHGDGGRLISYTSPFVIAGSLALVLAFSRIRLQSRAVNSMARSCPAVYLIHFHPLVLPFYTALFSGLYARLGGAAFAAAAALCLTAIFAGCIAADRVRLMCWNYVNRRLQSAPERS